jgi:hypothetical protein
MPCLGFEIGGLRPVVFELLLVCSMSSFYQATLYICVFVLHRHHKTVPFGAVERISTELSDLRRKKCSNQSSVTESIILLMIVVRFEVCANFRCPGVALYSIYVGG